MHTDLFLLTWQLFGKSDFISPGEKQFFTALLGSKLPSEAVCYPLPKHLLFMRECFQTQYLQISLRFIRHRSS